jgi:hypothetical protein
MKKSPPDETRSLSGELRNGGAPGYSHGTQAIDSSRHSSHCVLEQTRQSGVSSSSEQMLQSKIFAAIATQSFLVLPVRGDRLISFELSSHGRIVKFSALGPPLAGAFIKKISMEAAQTHFPPL